MKNIKRIIKGVLLEGIQNIDGEYTFDTKQDRKDDIIQFKTGISSVLDNMYGDKVLIGIPFNKEGDHSKKLQFIKDLKWGDRIPENIINHTLDIVVDNLDNQINLSSFDYIVSPKSSSELNKKLMDRISSKTDANVVSDFFIKNEVSKIYMDVDKAKSDGKNNKFIKRLSKRFELAKSVDNQSIKLQPLNRYERMYLRDFLRVSDNHKLLSLVMGESKVLVVDDIFSSGKTTNEMVLILKSLGVGDITIFTLFAN